MISIVIPNYNHGSYLKQRIESVLGQSYQDFELIILDDASTDNSLDIINNYRNHPKVAHIEVNERNSGSPFKQWQKGIELARGEYIWIAESDDWAEKGFLEKLIKVFEENKDLAVSYCQSIRIDADGKMICDNIQWTDALSKERWRYPYINFGIKEIKEYLIHKNTIPNASAAIFRKDLALSAIEDIAGFKYVGDWLFWIKMLELGNIAYRPERLNYFRRHGQSASNHITPKEIKERYSEQYDVVSYIKNSRCLSRRETEDVFNVLFIKWIEIIGTRLFLKQEYIKLFIHAMRRDTGLFRRFMRYTFGTYKKRLLGR